MLEICRITLREIGLRLKEPFRISSGVTHERRVLLIETRDRSGAIGWGECVAGETPHYSPETVDTAWLAISQWFAPRALGHRFENPTDLSHHLASGIRGHRMARAALEMATWELASRMANVSLARLLGGVREHVETGISLGIQETPTALADKAVRAIESGYRRVKLKIQPGADVEWVATVREALDPAHSLSVDANAAYLPEDTEHLKRLDEFALTMIEQPLASDDLVRHAELQRSLETPLCLDESITGLERAQDMATLGSGRIINIKPGRVGGFSTSIAIHDFAARHGIPVWCGGMLESGVGRAHNVALASLPHFQLPGDMSPSARYWERDVVTPEWTMDRGLIRVPLDRPGMGVDVDRNFVDAITRRVETLEP
jgi:O-succinylbenzoate synthase